MGKIGWIGAAFVALVALLAPAECWAQAPGGQVWNALRKVGQHEIVVRTQWSPQGGAGASRVSLETSAGSVQLHRGGFIRTAVAVRGQTVLVALAEGGARGSVRLALIDIGADGKPGQPKRVTVPRKATGGYRPAAVVACADPQGFTVLWQEQRLLDRQGARPDAQSFLGRIDGKGQWLERPRKVAIPWAFGAIAYNGNGYHLALFFDGSGPDQTRLCGVTLSAQGQPQQHPWWASRPQMLDEVQLLSHGGRIVAFFRGGPNGTELRSTDLTAVGQWGHEPANAATHGALADDEEFTVLPGSAGKPDIVRRRL